MESCLNKKGETPMDNIAKSLEEQLQKDLEEIEQQDLGSDARKAKQAQMIDLYRLKIEEDKLALEKEQKQWERTSKTIFDTLGIVVPNSIALYSVLKVMKFEETGFVKTFSARRILGWVKPGNVMKLFK